MFKLNGKIIKSISALIISYPLLLIIWLYVKMFYVKVIVNTSLFFVHPILNLTVNKVVFLSDVIKIETVSPLMTLQGLADIQLEQSINPDSFTFNVPLTLSLMAASYFYIKVRWRDYTKGLLLLIFGHLLYVFSYICHNHVVNVEKIIPGFYKFKGTFFQFLWAFTDNLIIRFEPFLIIILLWLVFSPKTSKVESVLLD